MASKLNLAVNYLLRFLNFGFGAFLAKFSDFFMGTQEAIINRLMLTNPGFGPYVPFSIFWALKRAWPHRYPYQSGASKLTKKLTHAISNTIRKKLSYCSEFILRFTYHVLTRSLRSVCHRVYRTLLST